MLFGFVDCGFVLVCGFRVCSGCFLDISDLCGVGIIYILLIDSWCCFVVALLFRLRGLLVFLDYSGLSFAGCFGISGSLVGLRWFGGVLCAVVCWVVLFECWYFKGLRVLILAGFRLWRCSV